MVAILYGAAMPISWPGLCAISYLGLVMILFRYVQSRAIHTVRKQINGFFTLQSNKKTSQNMVLQDESLSTPVVCVLYFKPSTGGRTVSVVIWRDSVPPDLFRRLRGWLHWCAS